jgi:ribonuclease VapC
MIVDTSAILSILLKEDDADAYFDALAGSRISRMSAVTHFECTIPIIRYLGKSYLPDLDLFIEKLRIDVVPFEHVHAKIARRAYTRFGKGRHPARLNFGDCVSYALAIDLGEPLLYKGGDFALTDVVSALPRR